MNLLLGIDVGTTRVKALLFDLVGNVLAQASQEVRLLRPHESWIEQDPEEIWRAVLRTAGRCAAQLEPGAKVLALSLCTQAGPTILVDDAGKPLRNAISWMDDRAAAEAEELKAILDPEEVYRSSGWWFHSSSVPAHIAWLRRHEPGSFRATRFYLQVNDLLMQRLTGEPCQDPSSAGYSQLYNIVESHWDGRALAALGIAEAQLPPVAPSGQAVARLAESAACQMGLSPETWVVNGAHDQYAAALGAGVVDPGQVLLSCGTAWVLVAATAGPAWGSGPYAMAVSRHAAPGRWGALSTLGAVGTTVEWYVDSILAPGGGFPAGQRGLAFELMNREVARAPAGARGLFCFPVAGGHAYWEGGRGALWGLTGAHGKYDIGRAALEGIAFELRWLIEIIRTAQLPLRSLTMVGGAARSSCWPQMIADVTGLPVAVPAMQEAGARGAALLAGLGLGCLSVEEGFAGARGSAAAFEPRPEARRAYAELFGRYQAARQSFQSSLAPKGGSGPPHWS